MTEFTNGFSEEIWASTYKHHSDKTVDDTFRRVAKTIASVEKTDELKEEWEEKFYDMLTDFKVTPGGRIYANAGTEYKGTTLLNCFVSPKPNYDLDSLDGILKVLRDQAQTLKSEGGWGCNFSFIRPRGAFIHGIGVETPGAVKYMEIFDKSSEIVTSGSGLKSKNKKAKGKIRKGAQMAVLDCTHPDIEEFITAKQTPGRLTKFNMSVNCFNEFMDKVSKIKKIKAQGKEIPEELNKWDLIFPDTQFEKYKEEWDGNIKFWMDKGYPVQVYKTVTVEYLWDLITQSTYNRNEPGVLFLDNANKTHAWNYAGRKSYISSTNPCITADTWIMTANGPLQVKELIGKEFKALVDGEEYSSENVFLDGQWQSGFFKTGTKKVYKILTDDGYSIRCTENHQIMVIRNGKKIWVEARDISKSDFLVISRQNKKWIGRLGGNFDEGYLLGGMLGDGWMNDKKAHLSFWGINKTYMLKRATQMIHATVGGRSDIGSASEDGVFYSERNECDLSSVNLCSNAKKWGLSGTKKITSLIEMGSSSFYKGFLSGWFDADGGVNFSKEKGHSVRLGSIHADNLYAAQRMLQRLGIKCKVYLNRRKAGLTSMPNGKGGRSNYNCKAYNELVISKENIVSFYENIGFIDPTKKQQLLDVINSYTRSGKPYKDKWASKLKSISYDGTEDVYDCRINSAHMFDANGIIAHNCGEQVLTNAGVCLLLSMNLTQFYDTNKNKFDLERLEKYVSIAVRFADNVNDYTSAPLQEYKESLVRRRRIGLGIMGWGSLLFMMNLRFGSKEAEAFKKKMMKVLTHSAAKTSVNLAIEKGMFADCDPEKHAKAFIWDMIGLDDNTRELIRKHGIRNSALFSIQPTGNTGVVANIVSGGCEPVFSFEYIRTCIVHTCPEHIKAVCPKYWEGEIKETEMFKWTKEGDEKILRGVDENGVVYKIDANRGLTKEVLCADYGYAFLKKIDKWDSKADWACSAFDLKVEDHIVDMMGWYQWIDSSISKTVNIPNEYSFDDFQKVYLQMYETGLAKGITTYRAGTMTNVLAVKSEKLPEEKILDELEKILDKAEENKGKRIVKTTAPKRGKTMESNVHFATVNGKPYYVVVGLLEGDPYEIFTGSNEEKEGGLFIPKKIEKGIVTKKAKGVYELTSEDYPDRGFVLTNGHSDDTADALTRMISTSLRHGADILFIVSQLEKTQGDLASYSKVLARTLKKYIPDGTKTTDKCPECGHGLIRMQGCIECPSCSYSKCS